MGVYQQIKDKFIMKSVWEDWAEYRGQLTDLILRRIPTEKEAGVAIVGAGRCNDMDLRRLAASTGHVYLFDIDGDAMQEAVLSLEEDLQQKVVPRTLSLTGIEEAELDAFCEDMLSYVRNSGQSLTTEDFRWELIQRLDRLMDKRIRTEDALIRSLLPKADVVVCCGVHSQFFSTLSFFLRSLLHSLKGVLPDAVSLEEEVNQRIRCMDDQMIPVINRALFLASGSAVIFGNEHMEDHPVEGAYQCIRDVRERHAPEEIHLLWDFNREEGITYDMLIQICMKG